MGRMHSGGKGIAKRSLPYKRAPPSWLKASSVEVEDHVAKLAKRGLTPSQVNTLFLLNYTLILSSWRKLLTHYFISTTSLFNHNKTIIILRSASSSEILTESPRSRVSPAPRSLESWRRLALLLPSPRICTCWLRRLSRLESTWRETKRTRTPSSDLFWSSLEFTDLPDITAPLESSRVTGSTNPPLPLLWSLKYSIVCL